MIAHNKIVASSLIGFAFVVWLGVGQIIGIGWISYLSGSAAFFAVACFLPESPKVTFLSRRSSLGLVGLFVWLAGCDLMFDPAYELAAIKNPLLRSAVEVGAPVAAGFGVFWLSIFLIRGLRAQPEYKNKCEQGGDGDAEEAV